MKRRDTSWPENTSLPRSIEELLAQGWEACGGSSESSDDGRIETGTEHFIKKVGDVELSVAVPYQAERIYGKPFDPRAVIEAAPAIQRPDPWLRRQRPPHIH